MSKTKAPDKYPIEPLGNRVAVRPADPVERSPGGIIMPDTAKGKPARGVVVAAGPGRLVAGSETVYAPMAVKVGDEVLYGKYSGNEVEVDGHNVLILDADEIYAKVID